MLFNNSLHLPFNISQHSLILAANCENQVYIHIICNITSFMHFYGKNQWGIWTKSRVLQGTFLTNLVINFMSFYLITTINTMLNFHYRKHRFKQNLRNLSDMINLCKSNHSLYYAWISSLNFVTQKTQQHKLSVITAHCMGCNMTLPCHAM
jgi:hypothetical protein